MRDLGMARMLGNRPLVALLLAAIVATVAPPAAAGNGVVRLEGRALADDDGPFLALGATLFWALWGEAHAPDVLDANLRWLAERGVDYVRVLGMVGAESWADRRIDPAAPDYWRSVDGLVARATRHGLRLQVTLFADAQVMMPDRAARLRFVDAWAERVNARPDRFVLVEIANEAWQNGLRDVDELRALGARLQDRTHVLVALSSPVGDGPFSPCAMYAGARADLATMHYDRDVKTMGPWGPVWQPWHWPGRFDAECRGRLPTAVNNEPIGPQSSVEQDANPTRLVMAYVTTFVAGNAAYVVHTGAGVRGGGASDRDAGRAANLWDVPGLDRALAGMAAAKRYLPSDLATWSRREPGDAALPVGGLADALAAGSLAGAFAATSGSRFIVVLLGLVHPVEIQARRACALDVRMPGDGSVAARHELAADAAVEIGGHEAVVLIGACRQ
jgi:hypothetical protein